MIKVCCRHLGWCQQSSGCASNGASSASQPWIRAGWVWSWTTYIWGVSGPLLISPAWQSSALINVAFGLLRFPIFQHLTGCVTLSFHFIHMMDLKRHRWSLSLTRQLDYFQDSQLRKESPKSQLFLSFDILWSSHSRWDANMVRHASSKMNLLLKSLFIY